MLDLIEAEPHKKKIQLRGVLLILGIIVVLVCIFVVPKLINTPNEETPEIVAKIPEEKMVIKKYVPEYTQEAKERLSNIYKSETKKAYLTFDDGPSYNVTPLILDVLKENDIKATFFVLGNRADQNPNTLKRVYEEGHYIANHGYSHVYSKIYETPEKVIDEYWQCEYAIRTAIQDEEYQSHLFRFPGGLKGGKYEDIKMQGNELLDSISVGSVDWNALTEDSAGKKTKEGLIQSLIDTIQGKNSAVILMHDASDKILTYETLQEIIDYLKNEGYEFCSFHDIMDQKEIAYEQEQI